MLCLPFSVGLLDNFYPIYLPTSNLYCIIHSDISCTCVLFIPIGEGMAYCLFHIFFICTSNLTCDFTLWVSSLFFVQSFSWNWKPPAHCVFNMHPSNQDTTEQGTRDREVTKPFLFCLYSPGLQLFQFYTSILVLYCLFMWFSVFIYIHK